MLDASGTTEVHPVQLGHGRSGQCPVVVTLKAYEVYRKLYGEQSALITGGCRGGFGANELIGFLYAAAFPQAEWRMRFDEALAGMKGI